MSHLMFFPLKFCAAFSFTGCFFLPSLVNALTPLVGRQEEHLTCKKLDIQPAKSWILVCWW